MLGNFLIYIKYFLQGNTWTLDDLEDDTVELIDEDTLLDQADLVKPDPKSLRQ